MSAVGQIIRGAGLALLCALAGCGSTSDIRPAGTGAREAATRYYEALLRKEWPGAYATLAAESKGKVSLEQFAKLAQEYRRGLGFEPDAVHIHACDENGGEAVAHVTLSGKGSHRHRYKDAVTLRRDGAEWAIVLPANFGRSR